MSWCAQVGKVSLLPKYQVCQLANDNKRISLASRGHHVRMYQISEKGRITSSYYPYYLLDLAPHVQSLIERKTEEPPFQKVKTLLSLNTHDVALLLRSLFVLVVDKCKHLQALPHFPHPRPLAAQLKIHVIKHVLTTKPPMYERTCCRPCCHELPC